MPTSSSNCPLCGYVLDAFEPTCPRCKGQGLPQNTPRSTTPERQQFSPPPPNPPTLSAMPQFGPVQRSRPRWGVPVTGAGATLLLALLLGYRYWISTPQYSLLQATLAFKAHDLGKFERYVAIDLCADAFTDDLFAEALAKVEAQSSPDENEFAKAGREMAKGFASLLKPAIAGTLKTKTRELVSTGQLAPFDSADSKGPVNLEEIKNNVEGDGLKYNGIGDVDIEDNTALVELKFHNEKQNIEQPVQLEMRRVEGHWQVSRWKNVTEWMKKAASSTAK